MKKKNKWLTTCLTFIISAATISIIASPAVISAKAANEKITVVKDDVTFNTLIGGDWKINDNGKISHRWSGGVTVKLSGYETAGNNVNAFATTKSVEFADDEDLMAEYDVLGVTSSTVHFGVMQGKKIADSSAWDYDYGYANTFGYYAGPDSKSFTLEGVINDDKSKQAEYKFPDVYENGAWVKAQKGNLDLTDGSSYRIRQVYRSAATGEQNAIEVYVTPLAPDGVYDWESQSVKRYRITASQIELANKSGFNGLKIGDGHVGINVEDVAINDGGGVILDNVKFSKISSTGYDIKSIIAQCDFENKKLSDGLTLYGLNTDKCLTYIDFSDVYFNNTTVEDLLYSNKALKSDVKTENVFDGSFDINVESKTKNAFIGIAFGLETAGEYKEDYLVAGVELNGGTAKATFKRGGNTIAESNEITFAYGENQKIYVSAANGENDKVDVTLSVGDEHVTVKVERNVFDGYFAIGNFSKNAAEFYLDNIDLIRYIYKEYGGKSLSADFNDGNPGDDWYFQSSGSVKLGNDIVPDQDCARYIADSGLKFENGALHFDRTGDLAMFGPKRSYGDWQFSFDLLQYQYEATSFTQDDVTLWTPASQWFGFSFHKGSYKSTFAASSVYSLMMTRRKTKDANKSELTLFTWQIPSYDGTVVIPVDAPVTEPLSIRITAVNQTITVEYKLVTEGDTAWKNVISFGDTDTTGYMSFSSTNWTNFTVDNVSVKNLDKYYEAENYPNLVISGDSRKTFDVANPEDMTFNINVGKYTFEVLGSKITKNDYVVDSVNNTITIKKEFLKKFPTSARNFYIRNQFGEELRVIIDVKNEASTENNEGGNGCNSSVGAACLAVLILPAAMLIVDKKRRQR